MRPKVPGALWRDDSDPWEEIKEQVRGEKSIAWRAYVDTIIGVVDQVVGKLGPTELLNLSTELRVPAGDTGRIKQALLGRLDAKARMEKIRYEPFEFEYFWYLWSGLCIYTQIIKRTGANTCWVLAYSGAAPSGEEGEINLTEIDRGTDIHSMSAEEFEKARSLNWPDHWE